MTDTPSAKPPLVSRALHRLGWHLLRASGVDWRVYTDLFVEPFAARANWKSGMGEALHFLYRWVLATRPQVVVEIGTARGRTACALALACRQNRCGKVYAIDPHTPNYWTDRGVGDSSLPHLQRHLADYRLTDWCEVVRATSDEAAKGWDRPIDFLLIDGDHTYEGVKRDFELFGPHVRPTGMVAFHDTLWELSRGLPGFADSYRDGIGVPQYMDELRASGYQAFTVPPFPGLSFVHPVPGGAAFMPDRTVPSERETV